MTMLEPRYGSNFTKKVSQSNPEDLLRRIMEANPSISLNEELGIFCDEALRDPDMNKACISHAWVNSRRNITNARSRNKTKAEYEKERAERKEWAAAAAAKVKHALLGTVMASTFGQVAKMAASAPQLAKLAKMGKANQVVGDVLKESVVLKVLKGKA